MAKTKTAKTDIDMLKDELDQLERIDPTPENRMAIASLISSVRARVENLVSGSK